MEKCDCLNFCGDDPWLQSGKAAPCDRMAARTKAELERAHVVGVTRTMDGPQALVIYFDRRPTDDDMRRVHEALR